MSLTIIGNPAAAPSGRGFIMRGVSQRDGLCADISNRRLLSRRFLPASTRSIAVFRRHPYLHFMATVFTIGHSTRSIEELIALLREHAIDVLVDVRTIPRSRRNPQFNAETLGPAMAAAGIAYRSEKALGGLRGKRKDGEPSPNLFWTHASFRNYADYALTAPFRSALADLEALARTQRAAIMCAEVLWWRCHRRIITDYLLADGFDVVHILGPGKTETAKLTPAAVRVGNCALHYPGDPGTPRLPGL